MTQLSKHQSVKSRFAKCEVCVEVIPIEDYFGRGDTIVCYGCGTEYMLTSKNPPKLLIIEDYADHDDYYGEMMFDD